jgi:hypothetical protein
MEFANTGGYLVEEGLEVHPFLGESLVLREVCIKSLEGSTCTVSTNESFKDGLETERPAKSASHLRGFGSGVSVTRSTTGGEEDSPRGSPRASDAAFSSPSLASPHLPWPSFHLSWTSLCFPLL